jgi:hypothetical protein
MSVITTLMSQYQGEDGTLTIPQDKLLEAIAMMESHQSEQTDAEEVEKPKKRNTAKKTKGPNAPKRAKSGYLRWIEVNRSQIKAGLDEGHKPTEVMREAGKQWKALEDSDKTPFEEAFKADQVRYKAEMTEYKPIAPLDSYSAEEYPEAPEGWSGPYQLKYLWKHAGPDGKAMRFKEFGDAIKAAAKLDDCKGITKTSKWYELRRGPDLMSATSGKESSSLASWAKCNINEFKEVINTQYIKEMLSTENNSIQKLHNENNAKLLEKKFIVKKKQPLNAISLFSCIETKKVSLKHKEDIRISKLCEHINSNTKLGIKLKESYFKFYNINIDNVIKVGGNKDHYDIKVIHTDKTIKKIEVKSSETFQSVIKSTIRPWEISVQFLNGPGNQFTIANYYAKLWYDNIICNRTIVEKYVDETINCPNLEEWKCKDAFKCGDPSTEFGITLKKNYRLSHPHTNIKKFTCMNGKFGSPIDYRKIVNGKFEFTEENKNTMINEVQEKYNKCMNEKEGWLQTFGDPDDLDNFNFRWFEKVEAYKIVDIKLIKCPDIKFEISCENDYKFNAILRWGKGSGFSNIRLDLK